MKTVTIIGAGPGGLAAGMLLQNAGFDVTIYEKEARVGGRNSAFVLGDYTFDIGPTFLMMRSALDEIFSRCGRNLEDYVKLFELDPMYRLKFHHGKELQPSRNPEKMKEQMEKFEEGSYEGYKRFLVKEKIKHDKIIGCLEIPYGSPKDLLKKQFLHSIPYLDAHVSLWNVLGRYFKDPDLRTAFTFQAKYIGMSPWTAPGTFSIISYIEHGGGIFHVEGGLNKLSLAMGKAFEEMGGTIQLNAPVKETIINKKKMEGVILESGEKVLSNYTVINADFAHAMTTVIPEANRKKYTEAKLDKKKYSCSTYMLYLGVKKEYPEVPHHSVLFAKDYPTNVKEITETKVLSEDFSFYVQNASPLDKTVAPKGKSTIYVLVPVPNTKGTINWKKEAPLLRDKLIDAMEGFGGYEDIRDNIEEELMITPEDWEERGVYKGATFNLAHSIDQMLLLRPHNQFEEFKNCYLVGGGTHPGSGLPTIYESGRISAELIIKDAS